MATDTAAPVTDLPTRVAQQCALPNAADARDVIVGATAMQLRGSSRSTRDVDILSRGVTMIATTLAVTKSRMRCSKDFSPSLA